MTPDLSTTNALLGVMAAVSVLEAVAIVSLCTAGFLLYRRMMRTLGGIEERQVAPAVARVNAILDDVKGVTSTVKAETGHVDRLLRWMIDAFRHRGHGTQGSARPL